MCIFQRICKQKTIVNPGVDHKGLDSFLKTLSNIGYYIAKGICNFAYPRQYLKPTAKG